MKERKIVQVAFDPYTDSDGDITSQMCALADDGSLWWLDRESAEWHASRIPSLPPREDESEKEPQA